MANYNASASTLVDVINPNAEQVDWEAARRAALRLRGSDDAELVVRSKSGMAEPLPASSRTCWRRCWRRWRRGTPLRS